MYLLVLTLIDRPMPAAHRSRSGVLLKKKCCKKYKDGKACKKCPVRKKG